MNQIFLLCAFILALTPSHVLAATTVYLSDGTTVLSPTTGGSPNPLPVLFVLGMDWGRAARPVSTIGKIGGVNRIIGCRLRTRST